MDCGVGDDPSLDPAFLTIARAFELGSDERRTTDWSAIGGECARLLIAHKDWRLATWLAISQARAKGWTGALEGLVLYEDFLQKFARAAYPLRERARAKFTEYLWDGLARGLEAHAPTTDAFSRLPEVVARIEGLLYELLGDASPTAKPLRELVRDRAASVAPPAAPVVAQPTPANEPPDVVVTEESSEGPLSPVPLTLASARDALRTFAGQLQLEDRRAPAAYRCARWAAWFRLDELPDNEGGRTPLTEPNPDDVADLRTLHDRGDWEALLAASEDTFTRNIWWLDAHYFTVRALAGLGAEYDPARNAVMAEVGGLLLRLPGVERLAFRDGSPFASARTLETFGRAPSASPPTSTLLYASAQGSDAGDDDLPVEVRISAALAAPPGRARFTNLLRIARAAIERDMPRVGRALCRKLLSEVDATLETWEPALCTDLLCAYARSVDDEELREALFQRLLLINPTQAIRM